MGKPVVAVVVDTVVIGGRFILTCHMTAEQRAEIIGRFVFVPRGAGRLCVGRVVQIEDFARLISGPEPEPRQIAIELSDLGLAQKDMPAVNETISIESE